MVLVDLEEFLEILLVLLVDGLRRIFFTLEFSRSEKESLHWRSASGTDNWFRVSAALELRGLDFNLSKLF